MVVVKKVGVLFEICSDQVRNSFGCGAVELFKDAGFGDGRYEL